TKRRSLEVSCSPWVLFSLAVRARRARPGGAARAAPERPTPPPAKGAAGGRTKKNSQPRSAAGARRGPPRRAPQRAGALAPRPLDTDDVIADEPAAASKAIAPNGRDATL